MSNLSIRFTRCYAQDAEGISQIDNSGVKFEIYNHLGTIATFGDFVKSDFYIIAELIAEFKPSDCVSLGFCNMSIELDSEFYNACKAACKAAGVEFVCTAG